MDGVLNENDMVKVKLIGVDNKTENSNSAKGAHAETEGRPQEQCKESE
jgi:predicted RNA-binding protein with RPS1 domain